MTEPPRRKRFQFHLSTAIVMMFVAGGLMWANLAERISQASSVSNIFDLDLSIGRPVQLPDRTFTFLESYYGWPANTAYRHASEVQAMAVSGPAPVLKYELIYFPYSIAWNVTFGVAVIVAVWFLCEWVIRRGAAYKSS